MSCQDNLRGASGARVIGRKEGGMIDGVSNFAHALMRVAIAQTISSASFSVVNESTLETLTDVAEQCKYYK